MEDGVVVEAKIRIKKNAGVLYTKNIHQQQHI